MDGGLITHEPVKKHGGWRPNAGRPRRDDWQDAFLNRLSLIGAKYRAAHDVGVDFGTVRAELDRSPAFAECFEEARQLYADRLEILLHRQGTGKVRGNPLPVFALLKKHRPQEYVERHMSLNVELSIDVPVDQARQVLGEMLAHVTPATVERLTTAERSDAAASRAVLDVAPQSRSDAQRAAHAEGANAPEVTAGERSVDVGHVAFDASRNRIQAHSLDAERADRAPLSPLALAPGSAPIPPAEPLNRAPEA